MSARSKFEAEVDAMHEAMFGPDALKVWKAIAAPANPLTENDEVPGADDLEHPHTLALRRVLRLLERNRVGEAQVVAFDALNEGE